MIRRVPSLLALVAPLALGMAACGSNGDEGPQVVDHSDPLMAAQLAGPIMIDPDMVASNGANQLVSFASADGSMPRPDAGPEAAAAARAEAIALVGGNEALRAVPDASGDEPPVDETLAACAGGASPSFRWAAAMPQAFPVYPRGAVLEAVGSDGPCRFRAISFASAVGVEDVLAFYVTRAGAAGYAVRHDEEVGGEHVLGARKPGAAMQVRVRASGDGLAMVDLLTASR